MGDGLAIAQGLAAGLAEASDSIPSHNELAGKQTLARRTTFVMSSAAAIAVAAALATLHDSATSTGVWGTVPAWVSAVGGSFAFFLAFWLFLQTRSDRIREQANAVYVTEDLVDQYDGSLLVKAHVHNDSSAPIWDVVVVPRHSGGGTFGHDLDQPRPDIQPKETQSFWEWVIPENEIKFRGRSSRLVFTDSTQRRWERTGVQVSRLHLIRREIRRRQELS